MTLFLFLALFTGTAHAATAEQTRCVADRSKNITQVEDRDGVWYHATSFAAQEMQPVPYIEITIMPFTSSGRGKRMAMYDYNNDGVVDYATWHKEIGPNVWAPIRPRQQYMSNWYQPSNVSPVNPYMQKFWQERFDEGIAIVGSTRDC